MASTRGAWTQVVHVPTCESHVDVEYADLVQQRQQRRQQLQQQDQIGDTIHVTHPRFLQLAGNNSVLLQACASIVQAYAKAVHGNAPPPLSIASVAKKMEELMAKDSDAQWIYSEQLATLQDLVRRDVRLASFVTCDGGQSFVVPGVWWA